MVDEIKTGKPPRALIRATTKNQPDDTRKNVKKLRIM